MAGDRSKFGDTLTARIFSREQVPDPKGSPQQVNLKSLAKGNEADHARIDLGDETFEPGVGPAGLARTSVSEPPDPGQANEAGVSEDAVAVARAAKSDDPKIAASLRFAAKVIDQRGKLPPAEVVELRRAGNSDTQIVDIVATVVLSLFWNYFNLAAGTEIESVTKLRSSGLTTKSPEG